MQINWNIDICVNLIFSVPIFAAAGVALRQYMKRKYTHYVYLILAAIFTGILILSMPLADMFHVQGIRSVGAISISLIFLCYIFLVDDITREAMDPLKTFVCGGFIVLVFIFSVAPDAFLWTTKTYGEGFVKGGYYNTIISPLELVFYFLILYYCVRINRNTPRALKRYSRLYLIGGCLSAFILPLCLLLGIDKSLGIPGFVAMMDVGIVLCFTIPFVKEPRLAFLLPFRVFRLTILDTTTGVSLYTHTWGSKNLGDADLYASMLQGVNAIIIESVNLGNVQEIHLEQGHLIIRRSEKFPVACVLVATRSTKVLRQTLDRFSARFVAEFADKFANLAEVSQFTRTKSLVDEYFPFVPTYD